MKKLVENPFDLIQNSFSTVFNVNDSRYFWGTKKQITNVQNSPTSFFLWRFFWSEIREKSIDDTLIWCWLWRDRLFKRSAFRINHHLIAFSCKGEDKHCSITPSELAMPWKSQDENTKNWSTSLDKYMTTLFFQEEKNYFIWILSGFTKLNNTWNARWFGILYLCKCLVFKNQDWNFDHPIR